MLRSINKIILAGSKKNNVSIINQLIKQNRNQSGNSSKY